MLSLETPPKLQENPSMVSVRDSGCPNTKEGMSRTKEFQRLHDKVGMMKLSRHDLCAALQQIAATPDGKSGTIQLSQVKPSWKNPPVTNPIPINMSISTDIRDHFVCEFTGKRVEAGSVVMLGPRATGSTGLCATRAELLRYMKASVQPANDGIFYTRISDVIRYWFTLQDAQLVADTKNIAFGVKEERLLPDGSVIASFNVLHTPADLAKFISDPNRILDPGSERPIVIPDSVRYHPSHNTVRDAPTSLDPLGHEGKICYNHVSYISRESWGEEHDKDRVAIYLPGQRSKNKLQAHCFVRSYLLKAMQSTIVYRWVGPPNQKGYADKKSPLHKLPVPPYWIDGRGAAALHEDTTHSYVLKKVDRAAVGTSYEASSLHGRVESIYTLVPLRNKADLIKAFL